MKEKTKHPIAKVDLILDDGDYYVDIDSNDRGVMRAAVSMGKTKSEAYRKAAKELRRLADECDKLS